MNRDTDTLKVTILEREGNRAEYEHPHAASKYLRRWCSGANKSRLNTPTDFLDVPDETVNCLPLASH